LYSTRFCPQGIPSGKKAEDMLDEVRKAAFGMRKTKAKDSTAEQEEEEEDIDESNALVITEQWETWYPQEWIGWCMYGVPSEKPTEFSVHQPVSNGPTDVESYFTDEMGRRKIRKAPGRMDQREKAEVEQSATKQNRNISNLMSQHVIQTTEEVEISRAASDIRLLNLLKEHESTTEEKEFNDWAMKEYLEREKHAFRARLLAHRKLREQELSHGQSLVTTPVMNTIVIFNDDSMEKQGKTNEEETFYNDTPVEQLYDPIQAAEYAREQQAPRVYFDASLNPSDDEFLDDIPQFATADTDIYDGESASSQLTEEPQCITKDTTTSENTLAKPKSVFTLPSPTKKYIRIKGKPPLHTKVQTEVMTRPNKRVTRSTPTGASKVVLKNPYKGMTWEDLNGKLHSKYPICISKPGFIALKNFNVLEANEDVTNLRALEKNDLEEDPDLELVGMWIAKIKKAILQVEARALMDINDSDDEVV
jgi:hypothetical protein